MPRQRSAGQPLPRPATTDEAHAEHGRSPRRTAAAIALLVLGLGLIGGAIAGNRLLADDNARPSAVSRFDAARALWHSTPVDALFPPVLDGAGAGPDGADRTWTRLGVAPASDCAGALDPALAAAVRTAGCLRVVRATYRDATSSDVTTVGLVFTEAGPAAMSALRTTFGARHVAENTALLPAAYPVPGTAAASFGARQRATWSIDVLTEAPVVVFSVTGFADGRTVAAPEPAEHAMRPHGTSAAAQAGLGFEAAGIADRVERAVHARTAAAGAEAR
ncbi:hypothetical protein [Streptomyces sp. NRRL F-5126]|uniref:hypothetical protein n=1 Tax=Streptomyces sp. NRRL F-5126 TaxID=1463857 RepID=UPI000AA66902|nr:hypothetical protein [Streptomyces sp. NRRL F-5126]